MTLSQFSHYVREIDFGKILFVADNQCLTFSGDFCPLHFELKFTNMVITLNPNMIYLCDSNGNRLWLDLIRNISVEDHVLGIVVRIVCDDPSAYYTGERKSRGTVTFTLVLQ